MMEQDETPVDKWSRMIWRGKTYPMDVVTIGIDGQMVVQLPVHVDDELPPRGEWSRLTFQVENEDFDCVAIFASSAVALGLDGSGIAMLTFQAVGNVTTYDPVRY